MESEQAKKYINRLLQRVESSNELVKYISKCNMHEPIADVKGQMAIETQSKVCQL